MPAQPSQVTAIRRVLRFYKISSYVTGIFLLLVMITWGIRRLPGLGFDLWAFGPNGPLTLEYYGIDGDALPAVGLNLTNAILIVHGWLYVVYLFADFRLWTLLRWPFMRFVWIALGGVVPFLSFVTEKIYARKAEAELAGLEKS